MTADPQDLLRLADEVAAATSWDPARDRRIEELVYYDSPVLPPKYTRSLDAAMTLIGSNAYWRLGNDGEGPDVSAFKATVTSGDGPTLAFHDAVAATPALSLCAAALKARAHSTKESDNG